MLIKTVMLKKLPCLFLLLIILTSCQKTELAESSNQEQITNDLNQFRDLKSPTIAKYSFKDFVSPRLMSMSTNDNSGCITTLHTQSQQFDKLSVLDPTSDILYVGSLFDGNTIQTGEYIPIFLSEDYVRKPITISVSIQGSSGTVAKTIEPALSTYRTAMQEITNAEINGEQPAAFTFEVKKVRSKREVVMNIGAALNVGGSLFTSTFNFDETSTSTRNFYLLKIYQKFYSADINIPQDGNLFNKPANYESNVAPVYVSGIDYGRSAYLLIESSYDSTRVKNALKTTFDFWKVDGSANISKEVQDVTDEMTISGTAIGGSSSLAAETISGLESFHNYVIRSGNLTPNSRGAIIAYRMRNAQNHAIYNTMINGDYYVRDCSGAKRLLYNFYSTQYGHIYTINSNFANERPGWRRITNDPIYVYGTQVDGSVPVYIMQHKTRAVYCLTTNNTIDLDVWASTGQPDFYAYKVPGDLRVPIHQFYNPGFSTHGYFYDITYNPLANGWVENGVKFYAFNSPN